MTHTKGRNSLVGALCATGGGICWGLSGSVGQFLFQELHMDSRWLVPIRLGIAGILLFTYCLIRYRKQLFQIVADRRDLLRLLAYGLAGVTFCQFFYFLTIQLSSAAIGTILQDLSPVMIMILACIMNHRPPRISEVCGILLALTGVFLLTTHGTLTSVSVPLSALVTGILSAVGVTIYNVTPGRLLDKYPPTVLQTWSFLMGSLVLSLVFRPWRVHYVPNTAGILGILFVAVVGNVMAFTVYAIGVKYAGPEKAVLYGFSEPVTAAIVGALFLGNYFTVYDALGFAAVFLMMVIISRKPK